MADRGVFNAAIRHARAQPKVLGRTGDLDTKRAGPVSAGATDAPPALMEQEEILGREAYAQLRTGTVRGGAVHDRNQVVPASIVEIEKRVLPERVDEMDLLDELAVSIAADIL